MRFLHRSASLVLSLTDALRGVGYCVASPVPYMNNTDLRVAGVNIADNRLEFRREPSGARSGQSAGGLDAPCIRLHQFMTMKANFPSVSVVPFVLKVVTSKYVEVFR